MKDNIIQFQQKPNLKDFIEKYKNEVNELTILRNEIFEDLKKRVLSVPNITEDQIKNMVLFYKFDNAIVKLTSNDGKIIDCNYTLNIAYQNKKYNYLRDDDSISIALHASMENENKKQVGYWGIVFFKDSIIYCDIDRFEKDETIFNFEIIKNEAMIDLDCELPIFPEIDD